MTALPSAQTLVASKTALVLVGRGSVLVAERLRLRHLAGQLGLTVTEEVLFRRRRRGAHADQLLGALPPEANTVLVEQLSALGREPISALLVAARLSVSGRRLISAEEPWAGDLGAVLPLLGEWLSRSIQIQRRDRARAALSLARCSGAKIGRPRTSFPEVRLVRQLVAEVGVAGAASKLACGETTLRRFLKSKPPESSFPVQSFSEVLQ